MKTLEQRPEGATVPVPLPPAPPSMAAVNPLVRLLLRSPLHRFLSDTLLLLTYTGPRSGKHYTIPVAYSRVGNKVDVFTRHSWWRNLRAGKLVELEIKGKRYAGAAEAITNERAVIAAALAAHLREHPGMARFYHVAPDANGQPHPDAVLVAAQFVVLVRIRLAPTGRERLRH